jgi:hypothetical protein
MEIKGIEVWSLFFGYICFIYHNTYGSYEIFKWDLSYKQKLHMSIYHFQEEIENNLYIQRY